MSREKFIAAKQLIDEKSYDEARAILRTINDPKAKDWLQKLDNIAPVKKQRVSSRMALIGAVVAVFLCIGVIGVALKLQADARAANEAYVSLQRACEKLSRSDSIGCAEWTSKAISAGAAYHFLFCQSVDPDWETKGFEAEFLANCLAERGVFIPGR